MSDQYVKLVVLLKKRPDLTTEEFRKYYETTHCKLVRLVPRVQKYFRRWATPLTTPLANHANEAPYDVITELWWKNREDFEFAMQRTAQPDVVAIISEDEAQLFDRSAIRNYVVMEESHSDLNVDRPAPG